MTTSSETERPHAVCLDGVQIETYPTELEALEEARLLKRDVPRTRGMKGGMGQWSLDEGPGGLTAHGVALSLMMSRLE